VTAPRDVDAAPVAWREAGAGDAILFLHGVGGSRTAWEPQLRDLSDRYRCVAWDMPGYGASAPAGELTFPGLADAAAHLLDAIGEPAAHVAGLSMGGMVAQHLALGHPARVRSLTLIDSSPAFGLDGTSRPEEWIALRLAPLDGGETPASLAPGLMRSVAAPGASDAALTEAAAAMARISPAGFAAGVRCLTTHDLRHRLHAIAAPTLVVCGEHDAETPPAYSRFLADAIGGARLALVPGAGHLSNLERPDVVNALLAGFLEELA
jgi:pimeloyl-ACP methyl ester carboxylesterase